MPVTAAPSSADSDEEADEEIVQSEPTAIQKADLLITQQWLRLIVWQSSFRQSLLSWTAPHESMHFAFPLAIARSTANVLHGLPSSAVEVHGMGIFEKIFEIGTWCMNVLGAIDRASATGNPISGIRGTMGMDFVGTGDLGVLGVSRKGVAIDPLAFFVRTLSATPNSRTQFAERLLMFAQERPGGMRMALTPSLNSPILPPQDLLWPTNAPALPNNDVPMGNVLGEVVKEENEMDTEGRSVWPMDDTLGMNAGASTSSLLGDPIIDIDSTPFSGGAPGNALANTRAAIPTSLSMPTLGTPVPLPNWTNNINNTTQDWTYDITSPTVEPATFSNNASAFNSGAGTPVGNFTGGIFSRQDSANSLFQYQERQQQQFGTGINGGSSNSIGMMNE